MSRPGGGPEPDHAALVRTAVRAVREAAGIDLACVSEWHPFMELSYHRAGAEAGSSAVEEERTLFLLPDLSGAMPDPDTYRATIAGIHAQVDTLPHPAAQGRRLALRRPRARGGARGESLQLGGVGAIFGVGFRRARG